MTVKIAILLIQNYAMLLMDSKILKNAIMQLFPFTPDFTLPNINIKVVEQSSSARTILYLYVLPFNL